MAVSATKAREKLRELAMKVRDGLGDIQILLSGKPYALLTRNAPLDLPPPVRKKILEVQRNWSEVLEAVTVDEARFRFKWKDRDPVYLVKDPGYRNSAVHEWREHASRFRPESRPADQRDVKRLLETAETLSQNTAELQQLVKFLYAVTTRVNGVYATPENGMVPLRNAADLEEVERD